MRDDDPTSRGLLPAPGRPGAGDVARACAAACGRAAPPTASDESAGEAPCNVLHDHCGGGAGGGYVTAPTEEHLIRDHVKFCVGKIVYASISPDETRLGFGFPKEERDALIDSRPDVFLLPKLSDQRFHWINAHMDALGADADARPYHRRLAHGRAEEGRGGPPRPAGRLSSARAVQRRRGSSAAYTVVTPA